LIKIDNIKNQRAEQLRHIDDIKYEIEQEQINKDQKQIKFNETITHAK